MPADCIYLDNIYYRHMIGRAGRRGFDTFGNVGKYSPVFKNFLE
jgi:replicative superfamily II helicase